MAGFGGLPPHPLSKDLAPRTCYRNRASFPPIIINTASNLSGAGPPTESLEAQAPSLQEPSIVYLLAEWRRVRTQQSKKRQRFFRCQSHLMARSFPDCHAAQNLSRTCRKGGCKQCLSSLQIASWIPKTDQMPTSHCSQYEDKSGCTQQPSNTCLGFERLHLSSRISHDPVDFLLHSFCLEVPRDAPKCTLEPSASFLAMVYLS